MLFAMLQDQHTKQIAKMEATNKVNMEAMMEKMNAFVAANTTRQPDKENIPPGGNNVKPPGGGGGDPAKKSRKKKALCPNCKCFAMHKPELCYELEANKAKRYPGWKSVFATAPST
jgi:hypothetical protein